MVRTAKVLQPHCLMQLNRRALSISAYNSTRVLPLSRGFHFHSFKNTHWRQQSLHLSLKNKIDHCTNSVPLPSSLRSYIRISIICSNWYNNKWWEGERSVPLSPFAHYLKMPAGVASFYSWYAEKTFIAVELPRSWTILSYAN